MEGHEQMGHGAATRGGFLKAAGAAVALGAAARLAGTAHAARAEERIGASGGHNGRYVEVAPGVRVFAQDWGAGKPIVLIHGWPLSYQNWEYQLNALPAQGFRCVAIDLRGFGQSDKPDGPYGYDVWAADIQRLLEALDLRGVTLVGHSMGGAIALHHTARYGDRVGKLVLAGAAAPVLSRRADFPQGAPTAVFDGLLAGLQADRPATLKAFGAGFFYKKISPEFQAWFNGLGLAASPLATLAGMRSLRDADLRADPARVQAPTLILHGIHDAIAPIAITGDVLAKAIAGATYVRFEQSGHGLFYDERDRFNAELAQFVG